MTEETEKKVSLSPPWITKTEELRALFGADPDIDVEYNDEAKEVIIESVNTFKIMALQKILVPSVTFGDVTLTIKCLVKDGSEGDVESLIKTAFTGNPHFSQVITAPTPYGEQVYALFKKEVIQFYNDDTSDYYGNWNGLSEDILRNVLNENIRVNIGTETEPDFDSFWDNCECEE